MRTPKADSKVRRGVFTLPYFSRKPAFQRRVWENACSLSHPVIGAVLLAFVLVATAATARAQQPEPARATVIVVVGATGESTYDANFALQAAQWESVCRLGNCEYVSIGVETATAVASASAASTGPVAAATATAVPASTAPATTPVLTDYDRLKEALAAQPKEGLGQLWLVLIGHGTFDGKEAKFNLRGPDVSAPELAAWLKPFQRPLAVIDAASASAPFLAKLTAPNRVVVTSTRSGNEHNFARFGQFLGEAMTDAKSDLDQDGQTSLLEAFLTAAARVGEFYKTEGRLATEHALVEDNGDGLGTPAEWFRGTRATKKSASGAALDGARARQFNLVRSEAEQKLTDAQREKRNELELTIEELREMKAKLGDEEYYRRLEALMIELAKVYTPAPNGT